MTNASKISILASDKDVISSTTDIHSPNFKLVI
jgi:hypothetical protein